MTDDEDGPRRALLSNAVDRRRELDRRNVQRFAAIKGIIGDRTALLKLRARLGITFKSSLKFPEVPLSQALELLHETPSVATAPLGEYG